MWSWIDKALNSFKDTAIGDWNYKCLILQELMRQKRAVTEYSTPSLLTEQEKQNYLNIHNTKRRIPSASDMNLLVSTMLNVSITYLSIYLSILAGHYYLEFEKKIFLQDTMNFTGWFQIWRNSQSLSFPISSTVRTSVTFHSN